MNEHLIESRYAWWRLLAAIVLGTIGGVGLWSIVVVLPEVQREFGVGRAGASLPYTVMTLGFAVGGVVMGRVADRFGVIWPVLCGSLCMALGYVLVSMAGSLGAFTLWYALLIGAFGSCAVFAPLVADTSHWFERRRGIAVALAASGNYFAGAIWPPVLQHFIESHGWRATHVGVGIFCLVTMLPLLLMLRRKSPVHASGTPRPAPRFPPVALPRAVVQWALVAAGICCCVAMSMPQVHIVAYCVDLGYGATRGAEMLALMLGAGIISRLASGFIADRIGGLRTLTLSSVLQGVALALYVPFDGLVSLYIISAIFGLFQGGLVPCYAIVVRENFPPDQAGTRVAMAFSSTLLGMALGGWMSGAIFDATGSYTAAVLNGLLWNAMNLCICGWMLSREKPRAPKLAMA